MAAKKKAKTAKKAPKAKAKSRMGKPGAAKKSYKSKGYLISKKSAKGKALFKKLEKARDAIDLRLSRSAGYSS